MARTRSQKLEEIGGYVIREVWPAEVTRPRYFRVEGLARRESFDSLLHARLGAILRLHGHEAVLRWAKEYVAGELQQQERAADEGKA